MDDATQVLGRRRVSAALWRSLDVMVEGLAQRRWRGASAMMAVEQTATAGGDASVAVAPTTASPVAVPPIARLAHTSLHQVPSSAMDEDAGIPSSSPAITGVAAVVPTPASPPALVIRARTPLVSRPVLTPVPDPSPVVVAPMVHADHGRGQSTMPIPLPAAPMVTASPVAASDLAMGSAASVAGPVGGTASSGHPPLVAESEPTVVFLSHAADPATPTAAVPSPDPQATWTTLVRHVVDRQARCRQVAVSPSATTSSIPLRSPVGVDDANTPVLPMTTAAGATQAPSRPSALSAQPWMPLPTDMVPPSATVVAPARPSPAWSQVREPAASWSSPGPLPSVTASAATVSPVPVLHDPLRFAALADPVSSAATDPDLLRRAVADLLREGTRNHGIHVSEAGHG